MRNWLAKLFGRRVIYVKSSGVNRVWRRWAKHTEYGWLCVAPVSVYLLSPQNDLFLCREDGTITDNRFDEWSFHPLPVKTLAQLTHEAHERRRPRPPKAQGAAYYPKRARKEETPKAVWRNDESVDPPPKIIVEDSK